MRWQKMTVNGHGIHVLDIPSFDEETIRTIKKEYSTVSCLRVNLFDLEYLSLFQSIQTMILTGGMPSEAGLDELYAHRELKVLVLDYEETDTDEDGIQLERFPVLTYVLSRSNLNIHQYQPDSSGRVKIDVVNTYRKGKPVRIKALPITDICAFEPPLFFSVEAQEPAAVLLMRIINELMAKCSGFNIRNFSRQIDTVSIIPICVSKEWLTSPNFYERKYVSLRKRTAELRIRMNYEVFVRASQEDKLNLFMQNVEQAASYIAGRDETFDRYSFVEYIRTALFSRQED